MKLHLAIRKAVELKGFLSIEDPIFINVLDDFNAFKDMYAYRNILRVLQKDGYFKTISSKGQSIEKVARTISVKYLWPYSDILYILSSLYYGLHITDIPPVKVDSNPPKVINRNPQKKDTHSTQCNMLIKKTEIIHNPCLPVQLDDIEFEQEKINRSFFVIKYRLKSGSDKNVFGFSVNFDAYDERNKLLCHAYDSYRSSECSNGFKKRSKIISCSDEYITRFVISIKESAL